MLLKLSKAGMRIKIVNVPSNVYEILEETGFTALFDVSKALRRYATDELELIGGVSWQAAEKISERDLGGCGRCDS